MSDKTCTGGGKARLITREGYVRKPHERRAYVRSDGTKVSASHVSRTVVPATKVVTHGVSGVGRPGGKGPKLINMADFRHLHNYGYGFDRTAEHRHKALDKATKDQGYNFVIRRLNALRTLHKSTNPTISKKAADDMAYVQKHKPSVEHRK